MFYFSLLFLGYKAIMYWCRVWQIFRRAVLCVVMPSNSDDVHFISISQQKVKSTSTLLGILKNSVIYTVKAVGL